MDNCIQYIKIAANYKCITLMPGPSKHLSSRDLTVELGQVRHSIAVVSKFHPSFVFQPAETNKTFECNICLKRFTRRTKLNSHLEAIHQQEQQHQQWRFQCPCCENESFRTLTQLITHCDEHHDIDFGI